jgi:hypothetical protein
MHSRANFTLTFNTHHDQVGVRSILPFPVLPEFATAKAESFRPGIVLTPGTPTNLCLLTYLFYMLAATYLPQLVRDQSPRTSSLRFVMPKNGLRTKWVRLSNCLVTPSGVDWTVSPVCLVHYMYLFEGMGLM